MSGSSAGTACTNATERSRVQSNYASALAATVVTDSRTLVEDAP